MRYHMTAILDPLGLMSSNNRDLAARHRLQMWLKELAAY
ncbi:hypothetical protein R69608_05526 [Paraburkholderia nemoris]|nr:hypothetical protein R69608_05526 [Paraburkholderia nemoris]